MAMIQVAQPPEYMKRLNAAIALREIPDFDAALSQLKIAFDLAPTDYSVQLLTGLTYFDLGQLDEAEEYLRHATMLSPDSSEAAVALGQLHIENNQYQEAVELLEPLKKDEAHNLAFTKTFADALLNNGQRIEAERILTAAYEHWPKDTGVASQLGHIFLLNREYEKAESILMKIDRIERDTNILIDLTEAQMGQNRYQEALDTIEEAALRQSESDKIWRLRARCLLNLEQLDRALEAAQNALSIRKDQPKNWETLADVYFDCQKIENGFETLEEGITFEREAAKNRKGLKYLLFERVFRVIQQNGVTAGLERINEDLQEVPDHTGLRTLQVKLLTIVGRYEEALEVIHAADNSDVLEKSFVWELFEINFNMDNPAAAWDVLPPFPEALEEREEFISHLEMVGLKLYGSNKTHATRLIFEKVVELAPKRIRSLNNLAFILIGEDEIESAKSLLQVVLREFDGGAADEFVTLDVTLANLSYIYMLAQDYSKAAQLLEKAEGSTNKDDKSILRVAYWCNGDFHLLPQDRHPRRFRNTLSIIRANLAIANYLRGKTSEGISIAKNVIEQAGDDVVGHRVLGCLYLDQGNIEKARQLWHQALELTLPTWERELFEQWLEDNPTT